MGWEDELRRKIEAVGDKDWERNTIVVPTENVITAVMKSVNFRVAVGAMPYKLMASLIGTVNVDEVAGVAAGRIMIGGFDTTDDYTLARFVLKDRPWNHFLQPVGGRWDWAVHCDSSGQLPYLPADFRQIPDPAPVRCER
jgi:hypothetical protein